MVSRLVRRDLGLKTSFGSGIDTSKLRRVQWLEVRIGKKVSYMSTYSLAQEFARFAIQANEFLVHR